MNRQSSSGPTRVPVRSRAPVVGITPCSRLADYVRSVERAGARVRVLEVGASPEAVVGEIDGLLLTGGGDVDPALYGESRHETVEPAEPGRDEFEIELARRAVADDLPLLAICRGAQVLNVAGGGTLVQDIPSAVRSDLTHAVAQQENATAHTIRVTPGSRLHQALGPAVDDAGTCRVNSRHHQSAGRVASGLLPSATAPDGVVEAIESPEAPFCIGVQWHPENFWRTGEFDSLFSSFVAAAHARMTARGAQPASTVSRPT